MKKISLQFHCLEKELYKLSKSWYNSQADIRIAVMQYFPSFRVSHIVDIEKIEQELNSIGDSSYKFIVFSLSDININSGKPVDFHKDNPNVLILQIGNQTNKYLFESWLCTTIYICNEESSKIWQKYYKELKKFLLSGAWAINTKNGAKEYYKDIRYSVGVKNLQGEGVSILPKQGIIYYDLLKDKKGKPARSDM